MSKALHLELPEGLGISYGLQVALNSRFLQIAEELRNAGQADTLTLQGAHTLRLATVPDSLQDGREFWETDRNAVYVIRQVAKIHVWAFEAGFYSDTMLRRPADLGLYDAGFIFFAKDKRVLYWWDGAAWIELLSESRDSQPAQKDLRPAIEDLARSVSSLLAPRQLRLHASTHQDGGRDEVSTTTPASGAIPKAGTDALLGAGWFHVHDTEYTARSSSIGTVTVAVATAGRYLVSINLGVTTNGAGTLQWTFSWVSNGVTRTITSGANTLTLALATSALTATYAISVDAGTNFTYATTYAAPGAYEFSTTLSKI